jgi:hypothetical protein
MNILCVADFDNGGAMASLWKALNKYTEHKARLITFRRTYLGYEEDLFNPPPALVEELANWADFYILGEVLIGNIQSETIYKRINPNNCIIRAGGSLARSYPHLYTTGQLAHIMKTGAFPDPILTARIYPMAHTVNMYHFDEWPVQKKQEHRQGIDKYRLVFSGTAKKQWAAHSAPIMEAWDMLKNEDKIEFVNIKYTPWAETLKIKATCDICYDQMGLGFYGSSAIEGMYYNMPTFCYISGWCKSIHPDLPLISTRDGKKIFDKTIEMIENPEKLHEAGKDGREYAMRIHDAKNAIKRWKGLIEFVSQEYRKP